LTEQIFHFRTSRCFTGRVSRVTFKNFVCHGRPQPRLRNGGPASQKAGATASVQSAPGNPALSQASPPSRATVMVALDYDVL